MDHEFFCLRVEVDLSRPLVLGVWFLRASGTKSSSIFKYEKLQNICFGCGIIGHEQCHCYNPLIKTWEGDKVWNYGP